MNNGNNNKQYRELETLHSNISRYGRIFETAQSFPGNNYPGKKEQTQKIANDIAAIKSQISNAKQNILNRKYS